VKLAEDVNRTKRESLGIPNMNRKSSGGNIAANDEEDCEENITVRLEYKAQNFF
jgi:MFS superfamily sulfate permease-like transporter